MSAAPAEPLTGLDEGGSLGIRQADMGGKVISEKAIRGCKVLILEQDLLIDQAGDVGQWRAYLLSGQKVRCYTSNPAARARSVSKGSGNSEVGFISAEPAVPSRGKRSC